MEARVLRVAATALFVLSLALACGEENSDEDEGDAGKACPADAPGNASSCSGYEPGLACTYGGTQCSCSGITWNCMEGGGNTNGGPTGSGGNGFGPGPTG